MQKPDEIFITAHMRGTHEEVRIYVDREDLPLVSQEKWEVWIDSSGYANVTTRDTRIGRMILGLKASDKSETDHVDRDPFNNRRANLRVVSRSQNLTNRGLWSNGKSPFKGTRKKLHRWEARIGGSSLSTVERHIGYFDTPEEAARAYDAEAISRYGVHALTNEQLGLLPPL